MVDDCCLIGYRNGRLFAGFEGRYGVGFGCEVLCGREGKDGGDDGVVMGDFVGEGEGLKRGEGGRNGVGMGKTGGV